MTSTSENTKKSSTRWGVIVPSSLKKNALPETNNSPLKMDGWNTTFLLGWPIFRCYVSFREVTTRRHSASFSPCCLHFGSSCYKKPFIAVDPIWHSKPCSANQRWKANHPGVSLVPRLSAKHGPLVTRPSHRYCHWKIHNPRRRVWEHYLWCWQEQKGDEKKDILRHLSGICTQ